METFHIAYCGLYCGACGKFKKGKCPGCQRNEKATWCEIRKCCVENSYATCAECTIIPLMECKKYHNFFAKAIGFVTRTDRSKCIERIKASGIACFAQEMEQSNRMSLRR